MEGEKQTISAHLDPTITNTGSIKAELLKNLCLQGEGFSIAYDPSDQYIAIGCYNGVRYLFSTKDYTPVHKAEPKDEAAVTAVKWRPMTNKKSKVLLMTTAEGSIQYYHIPSLKPLFSIKENDNSIHCCDFALSGEKFVTAGKDFNLRIYDQDTKTVLTTLGSAGWNNRGHANRVFSVKFIDENTIISGGWDSVIHLWDIRQGKSIKSSYGPHVAGDSIDFQDGKLLIGCYAATKQIQIWDYNKFQMEKSITWTSITDPHKVAYVYSARFSRGPVKGILAGSCGINEVKLLQQDQNGNYTTSSTLNINNGVFSVDWRHKTNEWAFTTAQNGFFVCKN